MTLPGSSLGQACPLPLEEGRILSATYSLPQCLAHSDSRGGISFLAIAFLLFVLAGLAACLGLHFEIRLREGLQDGSDAVAFSAALIHARGMNLIVLFNQVMMLLVAILVALRLAQVFFTIAAIVANALSLVTFGASGALAAPLQSAAQQFGRAYQQAKPRVFDALEALENAQLVTQHLTPAAAVIDSQFEVENHEFVDGAFALPSRIDLPVEKDDFSVLCGKSTSWAISLALGPLTSFSPALSKRARESSEGIGRKLTQFLCGAGKGDQEEPTHKEIVDQELPEPISQKPCEADSNSQACHDAKAEERREAPDPLTGNCPKTSSCKRDSLYEARARKARGKCDPMRKSPKRYLYQVERVQQKLRQEGGKWVAKTESTLSSRLEESENAPCGLRHAPYGGDWYTSGDPSTQPVCSTREKQELAPGAPGESLWIEFERVPRIFSCIVEDTREITLAEKGEEFGELENDRGPARLVSDVELGSGDFQVRSLAWKKGKSALAPLRPSAPRNQESTNSAPRRFAFSQAEYFFDHDGELPRSEWMWERKWRARLRKVHLDTESSSEDDGSTSVQPLSFESDESQGTASCDDSCNRGLGVLGEVQQWILH